MYFYFVPFIVKQNVVQKVKSFKFRFVEKEDNLINKKRLIENSILSTGNWYKIGVTQSGLYEMDKIFLSSMGIDVSDIDPKYIRLYYTILYILISNKYTYIIEIYIHYHLQLMLYHIYF